MNQYNDQIKATFGEQYSSVCHPTFIKEYIIDLEPCNNEWTLPIRTQEELTAITGRKNGIKKHMDNWFKWRKTTIHSDSFNKSQENQDKYTEQQSASKAKIESLKEYLKQLEVEETLSPEQLKAKREAELEKQQYQAQKEHDDKAYIARLLMISDAHDEFSNNVDIGSTIKVHSSWIPNYFDGSVLTAVSFDSTISTSTNQGEPTMFNPTISYKQQTTTEQAFLKGCYDEMVCMSQYATNQQAVKAMMTKTSEQMKATYQQAVKAMVVKKSIFTNSTLKFTVEQLLTVKGIGQVKAKAIMEFISQYAVTKIEQLAKVKGIGAVLLNTLINHKF